MDSNRRTRLKARKDLIVSPRPIQTRAPPIGQHPGVIKSELWMCVRIEFSAEMNACPQRFLGGCASRRTNGAAQFGSRQIADKGTVHTAAEVLFQLQEPYAAVGALVLERNESASFDFAYRHFRHDRHARTLRHHRQNCCKLSTFKDYVRFQVHLLTDGKRILAETVSFFEH